MPDLGILKRQQALLRLLKQPEDLLFGYWKYLVTDFAADAAMMAADPKTQGFWAFCLPCQDPLSPARTASGGR